MNPGLASTALGFATTVAVVLAATFEAGGLDDAYITYVFARHLADGEGFTWLPGGPRVYGTSTLPYALLLAAAKVLGADIPTAGMVIGLHPPGVPFRGWLDVCRELQSPGALTHAQNSW